MATYKILARSKRVSRVLTLLAYKKSIGFGLLALALVVGIALSNLRVKAASTSSYNLISVNDTGDGQGGDGHSQVDYNIGLSNAPVMSADGRYVLFESRATNLVSSDTNGYNDVFTSAISY